MSLDPALLAKSQALSAQTLLQVVTNFGAFQGAFDHLLWSWAGTDALNPAARGTFMDARKLGFMEQLFQQNFTQAGTAASSAPLSLPSQDLGAIYESVREALMGRFLLQTVAGGLYDTPVTYDALTDAVHFTGTPHLSSDMLNQLGAEASFSATPAQFWASLAYVIDATHNGADITPLNTVIEPGFYSIIITRPGAGEGLATLSPAETAALDHAAQMAGLTWSGIQSSFLANLPPAPVVADPNGATVEGTNGADVLIGGIGNDTLIGHAGADQLIGGAGNDVLIPGAAGSLLIGGEGSDTYIYGLGLSDYVMDSGGSDILTMVGFVPTELAPYPPGFSGGGNISTLFERTLNGDGKAYDLTFTTAYTTGSGSTLQQHTGQIVLADQFNPGHPERVIENAFNIFLRGQDGGIIMSGGNAQIVTRGSEGGDVLQNLDVQFSSFQQNTTNGYYFLGYPEMVQGNGGDDTITITNLRNGNEPLVAGDGGMGNDTLIGIGDGQVRSYSSNNAPPFNYRNGYYTEISLNGGADPSTGLGGGDDTFIAKSGNIEMNGGGNGFSNGSDTYIWQGGKSWISDIAVGPVDSDRVIVDRGNVSISDLTFDTGSFTSYFSTGSVDVRAWLNGTDDFMVFENIINPSYSSANNVEHLTFSYANAPDLHLDHYAQWQVGGAGDDVLSGQTALGQDGNDTLSGTAGDDVLAGGRGDDAMTSEGGSDYLDGGDGADLFVYSKPEIVITDPLAPPPPETHTTLTGGRGLDTFELHLTAAQFADPAVLNDILLYQNFLSQHTNARGQGLYY